MSSPQITAKKTDVSLNNVLHNDGTVWSAKLAADV